MTSLLSQARLPEIMPEFLTSWLGVFILLGGLLLMYLTIVEKLKPKKVMEIRDPFPVRFHEEVPTRKEFDSLVAKVGHMETSLPLIKEAIISEIHKSSEKTAAMINEVAENAREKRAVLHEKQNRLTSRVAVLEAKAGVSSEH